MTSPQEPPRYGLIHFHDLVALLDQKIFEIETAAAIAGPLETDAAVIADLRALRTRIVDDPGHCGNPSYVYRR